MNWGRQLSEDELCANVWASVWAISSVVVSTVSDRFRCWTFPPPPLPLSLRISLQTLLRGVRLLMEETNCLQHCLLFSLMTLWATALLFLKVVRFSAVGCLLNLRCTFFQSFIAFSQSASNHGLKTCFGVAEDLGMVSSAIEIKVSVKLAMASGLLWMSAVSLSSQRVRKECQSAFFSLQPGSLPPVAGPWWFTTMGKWSLPQRSTSTVHEKSNSRLGWVIVRSTAV